jgi:AcrR family transcriptional regulator
MSDSHLTEPMLLAAQLIAEAKLTHDEIAKRVGLSRQAVYAWRKKPEFAAEVERALDERRREIRRTGIAVLERRVAALNDRWLRMQQVIEARAADPTMQVVPGGPTGLLVHTVKGVGRGEDFQLIDLYEVDTGLLNELRQHEKQAAQELGQWTEKSQSSVELQGNSPIRKIQIQYLPPREIGDGAGE